MPLSPRPWVLLLPLLCAGPPAAAETLTLATYNVENYGPAGRLTAEGYRRDYPKPEAEKKALRCVIGAVSADVLALQEMGPAPYLEELRRDLRSEGLDYPYTALAEADDKARHIALLSRRPLRGIHSYPALEFAYRGGRERVKRGLLEAGVATSAGELTIFVVHLKSRLTEWPGDPGAALRRSAEAAAVRDCIFRRFPDPAAARFVLLGDFNDTRNSPTLRILQARGRLALALRLDAVDGRGETWTEDWQRADTYTQLDHILISPALRAAVAGAARIYDGPGVGTASDHRPLYAELTFPTR